MADWHLNELREAFERRGWRLVAEHPGDGYRTSASWEIARSGQRSNLFLDFDGLDDMQTLPLDESYGCGVRESRFKLYFSRRGETGSSQRMKWTNELTNFIDALDRV